MQQVESMTGSPDESYAHAPDEPGHIELSSVNAFIAILGGAFMFIRMPIINDDIALTVLAFCNISTVAKCRAVSRRLKDIVDKELTLEKADFSTPTFRQRRNITDSTMTPEFIHIFRRASIICLDGTEVGHYGAMKLVTDFTKELHVERCPRVDLGNR
ncbi:hypothetical protein FBU30_009693 [Linnemannia zychae]|nr:hypothetical protein FBU30_009693 [Linnemannia zychae]